MKVIGVIILIRLLQNSTRRVDHTKELIGLRLLRIWSDTMTKKTDIVRKAVIEGDFKKALQIAKGFRIGITKEQRDIMTRAYECIVHPEFYTQLGIDVSAAIEKGINLVRGV
jgi:hypothetical protein